MTSAKVRQEIEALRRRFSQLTTAILRISSDLEVDTVLQEVVEAARALSRARYGLITTLDATGQPQDFVSSGFSRVEHERMVDWPDGPRLFEHFRAQPGALRLDDLPAYVRSLGFSTDLILSRPSRVRRCVTGARRWVSSFWPARRTDRRSRKRTKRS